MALKDIRRGASKKRALALTWLRGEEAGFWCDAAELDQRRLMRLIDDKYLDGNSN